MSPPSSRHPTGVSSASAWTTCAQRYGTRPGGWYQSHRHIVDWVRAELAARGPLRPAQIEHDAKQTHRGPWWDWDVVKHALEHLWWFGEVAIAGRRGFERRYALAADVIPADVLETPVPRAGRHPRARPAGGGLVRRGHRIRPRGLLAGEGPARPDDRDRRPRGRRRAAARHGAGLAVGRATGEGVGAPRRGTPPAGRRDRDPDPVRPGRLVPRSRGAALRLRVPHRDLHARPEAAVRVLLAAGPGRRRPGRAGGSEGRPRRRRRCSCSPPGGSTAGRRMPRHDWPRSSARRRSGRGSRGSRSRAAAMRPPTSPTSCPRRAATMRSPPNLRSPKNPPSPTSELASR